MTALAGPATGWSGVRDAALGMAASTALLAPYALGGDVAWPLGFLMLVPWLLALNRVDGAGAALAHGLLMAVATTLAAFHWFGAAIGDYLGVGTGPGIALLALAATLLRQAADLGGAAGLTVALLASNEALAQAVRARRAGSCARRATRITAC